jgi:hypothetical protein
VAARAEDGSFVVCQSSGLVKLARAGAMATWIVAEAGKKSGLPRSKSLSDIGLRCRSKSRPVAGGSIFADDFWAFFEPRFSLQSL